MKNDKTNCMSQPKLYPMLFQPEMVAANLEWRKTKTRRIINDERVIDLLSVNTPEYVSTLDFCPYGQPGDILWVRENFVVQQINEIHKEGEWWCHVCIDFPASYGKPTTEFRKWFWVLKKDMPKVLRRRHPDKVFTSPSIHLPYCCCRLFLKVISVKVERLDDITNEDSKAEGVEWMPAQGYRNYLSNDPLNVLHYPKSSFKTLWRSINGLESWDANPWVWVIEFEKTEKPTA